MTSMSRIIFVRHGKTDCAGRFCGQIDPDLNAAGERQAENISRDPRLTGIRAIYSSDLRRARRTAEAIAARSGAALHLSSDLREIAFGAWEGLRWNEIERLYPEEAQLWPAQYPNRPAPGGESFSDFNQRVLHGIQRILEQPADPVCIVSHGGVIRVALTRLFGVSEENAWDLTREYGRLIEAAGKGEKNEHRN
jgi:alpha-ribazole phosphatase